MSHWCASKLSPIRKQRVKKWHLKLINHLFEYPLLYLWCRCYSDYFLFLLLACLPYWKHAPFKLLEDPTVIYYLKHMLRLCTQQHCYAVANCFPLSDVELTVKFVCVGVWSQMLSPVGVSAAQVSGCLLRCNILLIWMKTLTGVKYCKCFHIMFLLEEGRQFGWVLLLFNEFAICFHAWGHKKEKEKRRRGAFFFFKFVRAVSHHHSRSKGLVSW